MSRGVQDRGLPNSLVEEITNILLDGGYSLRDLQLWGSDEQNYASKIVDRGLTTANTVRVFEVYYRKSGPSIIVDKRGVEAFEQAFAADHHFSRFDHTGRIDGLLTAGISPQAIAAIGDIGLDALSHRQLEPKYEQHLLKLFMADPRLDISSFNEFMTVTRLLDRYILRDRIDVATQLDSGTLRDLNCLIKVFNLRRKLCRERRLSRASLRAIDTAFDPNDPNSFEEYNALDLSLIALSSPQGANQLLENGYPPAHLAQWDEDTARAHAANISNSRVIP
ncbi:MAG: hypothetical protein AAF449_02985 [Myxococcota bacterium]